MITKNIDALQKVFATTEPTGSITCASALANEKYNFQVATYSAESFFCKVSVNSDIASAVSVKNIFSVPSDLEIYPDANRAEFFEFSPTGTYPDVLKTLDNNIFYGAQNSWQALWVSVDAAAAEPGSHKISIVFSNPWTNEIICESEPFVLDIYDVKMDEQTLIYTNWFHCDGIMGYYNEPAFTERFWAITSNFMKTAAEHGMNMILTPVFTPPLDTARGKERPTVQLIDVKKSGKKWTFGFDKLGIWIDTAHKNNITYFEISHLFTQWGVTACPKIVAEVDGAEKRVFGWDTASDSPEYIEFLDAFLPLLVSFLKEKGVADKSYIHISDEPNEQFIEKYSYASQQIKKHIGNDIHTFDALSSYSFYEKGLVETPIPDTGSIEEFSHIENLWTYYCCGQYKNNLSNRFFCMPSARNRVLGVQLYIYNVKGFLHWGYNFYNTQNSFAKINPYQITAGGATFPSGDSFVVYPDADGTALASLRYDVFFDALQDLRALQTLEKNIGRERVLALIHEGLKYQITMTKYPTSSDWLLNLRQAVNNALKIGQNNHFKQK